MIYFDTSALLRRYFNEPDADSAMKALSAPGEKLISGLVLVELASVFRRALRGREITRREHTELLEISKSDLLQFKIIGADEGLFRQAALVADLTGLKTLDAIHLASARMGGAEMIMTYDKELINAAKAIGLKVWH